MRRWHGVWLMFALVGWSGAWLRAAERLIARNPLSFRAASVNGDEIELPANPGNRWTVVCFLGTECPLARLYGPRLQQMSDEFADKSVRFLGVYSNQQDTPEEIRTFAVEHGLRFPLIKDENNVLADRYRATRTPEVVVVDSELLIQYRGRIDDQYLPGVARTTPQRHDLREALAQLTTGRPVDVSTTEPAGCLIGRVKMLPRNGGVTYCDQVARILNRHCVECHRAGEIGPFALTDYSEIVGWADMILEVVNGGRMPPWHANPEHGEFKNARRISPQDQQLLAQWVEDGAPYGDESQLPELTDDVAGWQLPREPDQVIEMRDHPFEVPSEGTVEYQYFVVDPGFKEDRWVTAAQVIPGNPAVVHHSIVFIRPPDGARFRGVGWLGAYVPGQRAFLLPEGRARFVPAGSKFVFQQHYTPNGQPQADLTRVGLLFCDADQVTHEVFTLVGIDQEFEIPPYASTFAVDGEVRWFPPRGELLAIMPHMHLRGKSFRFSASVDGDERILLDVPRYDFNWQHVYELMEPLSLTDVDALKFSVIFDNSASNPFNPDPSQHVTWGDQTWEEMAVAFFEVAEPLGEPDRGPKRGHRDDHLAAEAEREQQRRVDDFFVSFDHNRDGIVERMETPLSFRRFAFGKFDLNGDERLTRNEIEQASGSVR